MKSLMLRALLPYLLLGHLPARPGQEPEVPFPAELVEFSVTGFRGTGLTDHLRQSVAFDSGGTAVKRRVGERDVTTGEFLVAESVETVSFRLTDVGFREGGNELYVAGIEVDGEVLIERWVCPVRPGGFTLESTTGDPQPIGTPMPPYTCQEVVNGEVWVQPSSRKLPPVRRRVWFRSSEIGPLKRIVVDPEGRYLIALVHPSGDLVRLELSSNDPAPVVIASAASTPHLTQVKTLTLFHHANEGRKLVLTELAGSMYPPGHKRVVLTDTDNDGVFESPVTLTSAEWAAAGYEDGEAWSHYWNCGVDLDW